MNSPTMPIAHDAGVREKSSAGCRVGYEIGGENNAATDGHRDDAAGDGGNCRNGGELLLAFQNTETCSSERFAICEFSHSPRLGETSDQRSISGSMSTTSP